MRTRQKVDKIGISHESDNSQATQPKDIPVNTDRNKRKNSQSIFDNKGEHLQKPLTTERRSRSSLSQGHRLATDTATANPSNHRAAVITNNRLTETDSDRGMSCIIIALKKLSKQVESLSNFTTIIAHKIEKLEEKYAAASEETTELKNMLEKTKQNTELIIKHSRLLQQETRMDRREDMIEKRSHDIIAENAITWRLKLNQRKISYWHCLQNAAKAELYNDWLTESPDYLPLKYRPKINESDSDFLLQMKSEEAHQKYINDIDLMYEYSYQHEEKILEIEDDVKTVIEEWTTSEEEISCIQQIWTAEVKKNEKISQQLWKKRLDFLLKKKREEEEQDDTRFINEEQEKEIKRRSHLKRNRFKIRWKSNRPPARRSQEDSRRQPQSRRGTPDSPGRNHDNWRLDCTTSEIATLQADQT